MIIYENCQVIDVDVVIYDPFAQPAPDAEQAEADRYERRNEELT